MPTIPRPWSVVVSRDDVSHCESKADVVPGLDEGQALLQIERLALTANTLTYAAMGDRLGFWSLFPAAPGWVDNAAFGADELVVVSASSKTALGLTHLLRDEWSVTGSTSERSLDWLRRCGVYRRVVTYETIDTLELAGRCVVIDFLAMPRCSGACVRRSVRSSCR